MPYPRITHTQQSAQQQTWLGGAFQRAAVRQEETSLPNLTDPKTSEDASRFQHDFSRVPVSSDRSAIQPKREVAAFGQRSEPETDRISSPVSLPGANRSIVPESQRFHPTGLPERLKVGIETLSGISMDNVRVHYNSPKPIQIQALAYTQGRQIHIAPGQEKHLPHEAWHIVQQQQGRVSPTLQAKQGTVDVSINNDASLEQEADVMGAKALQGTSTPLEQVDRTQPLHTQPIGASQVIQRSSLTETSAEGPFDSPFTILQRELPSVNLFLSSVGIHNTQDPSATQAQYKRPKQVDAVIYGPRRPTGSRPPSSMPASVGNLGNQELLIRNGIRQQTFEGGHLIGDELLPPTVNSMVDWNLAPQNSNFNHPVYFGLAEELIFEGPINAATGRPDHTIPVDVQVKLAYPATTFTVSVSDLINNNVIANNDPNLSTTLKAKTITFPSRVPHQWDITATLPSTPTSAFPQHTLTTNQKSAFNSANDLSTPLSHTDFLVSSPDLLTVHGVNMIGGGSQLRLLGMQGDTDPSNTNANRSGNVTTISSPVSVPPAIFSGGGLDINLDITMGNGELSATTLNTLIALVPKTSTHIKAINAAVKNRFKLKRSGGVKKTGTGKNKKYKIFNDHRDWVDLVTRTLPKTPGTRALLHRLQLDRSINY